MTGKSAASIRDRLLNLAKERGENFDFILNQYAIQRLLYRLSVSEYRDQYLLKGAWLFSIWAEESHRPTRDADLLGFGDNDVETLIGVFRSICSLKVDDGLEIDIDSLHGVEIKEDAMYQGVRITGYAYLAKARIAIQVDVAHGDAVTPEAEEVEVPVFLDLPSPKVRAYPVYSVIAEKFQAMVVLGLANSRMKDFYDIWRISRMMNLDGKLLSDAIWATFARRETKLDGNPLYLFSEEFYTDEEKQKQWTAFCKRNRLEMTMDFPEVIKLLEDFLEPIAKAASDDTYLDKSWSHGKSRWID